ncbi:metal-independent alpha-mannosidase, partial [archaeon]
MEHGRGYPVKYTGLIKGGFRASDDATVYSYNIPENAFACVALREVTPLLQALGAADLAGAAKSLSLTLQQAITAHGIVNH